MDINVNGLILRIHPVDDKYAASRCGKVVNFDSEAILRRKNKKKRKSMMLNKFIYECYHGLILDGMDVVHIDGDVLNNNLSNFQLVRKRRK